MKVKYILLLICLFLFSGVQSSTTISFDSAGTGYTLNSDKTIATLTGSGPFDISGSLEDKKIIVSSSCTINLNSLTLSNSGSLTPILISASQTVEFVLTGISTLTDSSSNEYEGTIFLQSGASLTISGIGSLKIYPNKMMAINGTDSTSLTVEDGATINVESRSSKQEDYI